MVHALKTLRPYFLDKPFELYNDNEPAMVTPCSATSITTWRCGSNCYPRISTESAGPTLPTS